MSRFNIANADDFAKVTMSQAGGAVLALQGGLPEEWDISEAAYGHDEMILFHVFSTNVDYLASVSNVSDSEGRRKAIWEYPYRDGQSTDDMGRRGSTYEFNAVIFGERYKKALDRLKKELNDPRPGVLIHPVLGRLNVVADDWSTIHESGVRKAATIRIRFIEHTFDTGVTFVGRDVNSRISGSLKYFKQFDDIMTNITANELLLQTAKNTIIAGLNAYKNQFSSVLSKLNATYNPNGASNFPSLLPTNQGGSQTSFPVVQSPSDPYTAVPVAEIESAEFPALASEQAVDLVSGLRGTLNQQIANLSESLEGQGALEFSNEILELKNSGIEIQGVIEAGLKSSNAKVIIYKTARLMSVREVAFDCGLTPDRSVEIELLNPDLESLNFIEKGISVRVPAV